jgi:hypothetical protein
MLEMYNIGLLRYLNYEYFTVQHVKTSKPQIIWPV